MDFNPQQLQQFLASQQKPYGQTSPLFIPKTEIPRVSGKSGAENLPMGPDSTVLAVDESYTSGLLVWFIQTDGTGRKTMIADYDMTPHVHEDPPDFKKMQTLMEDMASRLDNVTTRISTIEEALK